ncbi:flagellar motor switch protein FliN/FliY [Desulfuromusa kysingii]|uniref:Flagellar motor switch protein FliN n=1 Tax=Desulfuromusa kysingii TaxID=37625 RepID=A0A1H3VGT5_9BACT|nr:flagellar motor switch protein FliN [Desulfuromusa kysingii]SDZ74013.1 flagellar motor switch protein FliN/FliY [Desulfuromusa kysingii]
MSTENLENGQAVEAAANKDKFDDRGIDLLLDIPLEVSVEVGRSRILVRDLLQLQEGSLVELDKLAGEPLDLYVNSRLIARGEAVVVNEKFGLRLTDVVSPSERIEHLG